MNLRIFVRIAMFYTPAATVSPSPNLETIYLPEYLLGKNVLNSFHCIFVAGETYQNSVVLYLQTLLHKNVKFCKKLFIFRLLLTF